MIINSITHKKEGTLINYGDDCNLLIDTAIAKKYDFKEEETFNISEILSANEEYAKGIAKEYALNFLSYATRSEKQVYAYLRKKHIQKQAVLDVIEILKSHNYINDRDYASTFCENMKLSGKSRMYIAQKLKEKGVDLLIIDDVLQGYNHDEQYGNAERFLIGKNRSLKKYPPQIRKEKLYRSALSQGFGSDMVQKITDKLLDEEDADFDDYYRDVIIKKINSLKKKNLSDKELRVKVYTALLPKGAPKDMIDNVIYEFQNNM